jgi:hypothetical protein
MGLSIWLLVEIKDAVPVGLAESVTMGSIFAFIGVGCKLVLGSWPGPLGLASSSVDVGAVNGEVGLVDGRAALATGFGDAAICGVNAGADFIAGTEEFASGFGASAVVAAGLPKGLSATPVG